MSLPHPFAGTGTNGPGANAIHAQLLHVSDCPLVGEVRTLLDRCLSRLGLRAVVEKIEGPYPSPTLLIDGADVIGRPVAIGPSCRLDPPTDEEIFAALTQAERRLLPLEVGEGGERCA